MFAAVGGEGLLAQFRRTGSNIPASLASFRIQQRGAAPAGRCDRGEECHQQQRNGEDNLSLLAAHRQL